MVWGVECVRGCKGWVWGWLVVLHLVQIQMKWLRWKCGDGADFGESKRRENVCLKARYMHAKVMDQRRQVSHRIIPISIRTT